MGRSLPQMGDWAAVPPHLAGMLREAGFSDVDAFGSWDGDTPASPEGWRLILRAR